MKVEVYFKDEDLRDFFRNPMILDTVSVNLRSNFLQLTDKDGIIHAYNTDAILHYHVI